MGTETTKAAWGKVAFRRSYEGNLKSTKILLSQTQWQTENDLLDCQWEKVYYDCWWNKQGLVSANIYGNNVFKF